MTDATTESKQVAFVLDIDGCLSREGIPIPSAKAALHRLRSTNTPFVFCTNGGGQLESQRAEKLSKTFDLEVSPDQIILSHTPLREEVVERLKDERVLIVGENCGPVARAYGLAKALEVSEFGKRHPSLFPRRREAENPPTLDDDDGPVKAVLFFEDPEDLGEALQVVLDVILTNGDPSGKRVLVEDSTVEQEVEVWFTNPDLVYSGLATNPRLTQGSYRLCLETLFQCATSSTSTSYYSMQHSESSTTSEQTRTPKRKLISNTVGKPTPLTGRTALNKILSQCTNNTTEEDLEIWTVGDNPFSDVALALMMGWNAGLVKTGIWDGDVKSLEKENAVPTRIVDDVGVLIGQLLPE